MNRIITSEEVKKHASEKTIWMIIHNEVYDVTKFLDEHPGGPDSLMDYAGKDGTQAFEDVGHSDDARVMMNKYKIGTLPPEEQSSEDKPCFPCTPKNSSKSWRTFDGSSERYPKSPKSDKKSKSPKPEKRVKAIVVPKESSSNLKWILLALGAAIVIGVVAKKYMQ